MLSPVAKLYATRAAPAATTPVTRSAIGFAFSTAFQAAVAAVARVIFPVSTPTTISFAVSAPVDAASCSAFAFSIVVSVAVTAVRLFRPLVTLESTLYILNAVAPATTSGISVSMLSAVLSTAFVNGGNTVFVTLETTLKPFSKIFPNVWTPLLIPPPVKLSTISFTASFTGLCSSVGNVLTAAPARVFTISAPASISSPLCVANPSTVFSTKSTAASTILGASAAAFTEISANTSPASSSNPFTP